MVCVHRCSGVDLDWWENGDVCLHCGAFNANEESFSHVLTVRVDCKSERNAMIVSDRRR